MSHTEPYSVVHCRTFIGRLAHLHFWILLKVADPCGILPNQVAFFAFEDVTSQPLGQYNPLAFCKKKEKF